MELFGLKDIISTVGKVADDLFTSDEEMAKLGLEEKKLDVEVIKVNASLLKGQQKINAVEAKHRSIWVAGWRPAIGWVCAAGLSYQFLLYPILMWFTMLLKVTGVIPGDVPTPPILDTGPLMSLVTALLGLGGLRTFEKLKNKTK